MATKRILRALRFRGGVLDMEAEKFSHICGGNGRRSAMGNRKEVLNAETQRTQRREEEDRDSTGVETWQLRSFGHPCRMASG
jgi:hypothetical protein